MALIQVNEIAESFKQVINLIPTLTLCGVVWTAAKVISKVNYLNTEVRRLRYKVHKLNNILTVVVGKTANEIIDEDEDPNEL